MAIRPPRNRAAVGRRLRLDDRLPCNRAIEREDVLSVESASLSRTSRLGAAGCSGERGAFTRAASTRTGVTAEAVTAVEIQARHLETVN